MQNRTHRGTVVSRNLTEEQLEVEFVQAFRDLLNASQRGSCSNPKGRRWLSRFLDSPAAHSLSRT